MSLPEIAHDLGIMNLIYYALIKSGLLPPIIFMGVGALTDFGPMLRNLKLAIFGAGAQFGIFAVLLVASQFFTLQEAGSLAIIGGADGPTAIFTTLKLAPHLLAPIAIAAYSYMALVPVIIPLVVKLTCSKKELMINMKEQDKLYPSKTEFKNMRALKIIFPIAVTIFVSLLVPSAAPLIGCLMLGNLWKESGVAERLCKTAQNELMNIVTIFLGISVGATATAETFLDTERNTITIAGNTIEMLRMPTIEIIVLGIVAFGVATACGVLFAKFMNLFTKNKINPLIGSAGVSAVPMAARVSQTVGQKENPANFLLMHAMGPNVAGVIGSAIAAGALIAIFG
jgi:oxaloacetate decarboxylase beta subunit